MTDHQKPQRTYLFGPVPSRRLGASLGIDLVPHKTCTFNCIYCECGKTTNHTCRRSEYVSIDAVKQELHNFLACNPAPDYITFSGAGEPCLNSRMGELIAYLKQSWPDIPLAVITNGSLFSDQETRKAVLEADLLLPSLDAATEEAFRKVNRPAGCVRLNDYIQGLVSLREEFDKEIWLEVFIVPEYNDDAANLEALREAIIRIRPDRVQLNSLDRPGTLRSLQPATPARLEQILDHWKLDHAEIISSLHASFDKRYAGSKLEELIYNTISRRPCTTDDLEKLTGAHIRVINKYLLLLENKGLIRQFHQARGDFYAVRE